MRARLPIIFGGLTVCLLLLSLIWTPELASRWLTRDHERDLSELVRTPAGGNLWIIDARQLRLADRADNAGRVPPNRAIALYQNGQPLQRSHSHAEIQTTPGLFSHWGDAIYFSPITGHEPTPNDRLTIKYQDSSKPITWLVRQGGILLALATGLAAMITAMLLFRLARFSETTTDSSVLTPASVFPPVDLAALLAAVVFCAISIPLTLVARNDASGWTAMTRPGHEHITNTQLGYCCFLGGIPVMEENAHSDRLVGYLSGIRGCEGLTCYAYRGWYSFSATLLAPLVGVIPAMQLVNWLGWAGAAWAAYCLAYFLGRSRLAGILAVVFVSAGMGMITHIGDYSAHLIAFTVFYIGVFLIRTSGVLTETQPLSVHLFLGGYLAVASLTYTNGPILVVLYALSAVRFNRWLHIGTALALAGCARPAWEFLLARFGLVIPNDEGGLMVKGLRDWMSMFADPWVGLRHLYLHVTDLYSYEVPLTLGLGLFAWLALARRREDYWFGALVLLLPTAAVLPFCPVANARGYLVYGSSIWLITWLSILLARMLRQQAVVRWGGVALTLVVLGGQFAWSTAHIWGHLGPVKTYYVGYHQGSEYFRNPPTTVLSLTDSEPTPLVAGGTATLEQAGAYISTPTERKITSSDTSLFEAFRRRILFFVFLAFLVATGAWRFGASGPLSLGLGAFFVALAPLTAFLSVVGVKELPVYHHFKYEGCPLAPGAELTYRISLGDRFLETLEAQYQPGDQVRFFIQHHGTLEVNIVTGMVPLDLHPEGCFWTARDSQQVVRELRRNGNVSLRLRNPGDQPLAVCGWQRRDLPHRSLVSDPTGPALPALEIRIYRPDQTEKLAGF